ncbi:hypothetical protein BP6252_05382 [Coleophoma cylindrospora]|uniref:Uncharacterized protein n=1 Tax=Coleophoma cylindrospora TaxID=1849047 RepID=A0A3D8RTF3_9HELO|nr:hypothetical protein BP6252_05382 [Coleophoma cylindrospora]
MNRGRLLQLRSSCARRADVVAHGWEWILLRRVPAAWFFVYTEMECSRRWMGREEAPTMSRRSGAVRYGSRLLRRARAREQTGKSTRARDPEAPVPVPSGDEANRAVWSKAEGTQATPSVLPCRAALLGGQKRSRCFCRSSCFVQASSPSGGVAGTSTPGTSDLAIQDGDRSKGQTEA